MTQCLIERPDGLDVTEAVLTGKFLQGVSTRCHAGDCPGVRREEARVGSQASEEYDWWFRAAYAPVSRTVFLIVHDRSLADEIAQDRTPSCSCTGTGRQCRATSVRTCGCAGSRSGWRSDG
jgi:hypothetical protein